MEDKLLKLMELINIFRWISRGTSWIRKHFKNSKSKKEEKNGREYKFISYNKSITIFKDGHGIIQLSPRLKVKKDNFEKIKHSFDLKDCGHKSLTLDPLQVLADRVKLNIKSRFSEQTFFCKLISMNNEPVEHSDRWLQVNMIREESFPIQRSFFIKFENKNFKKGDEITYLWGYSCPRLYPTQKSEMANFNPGNLDYCETTLKLFNDVDLLQFVISFEEGIRLDKLPELWKRDQKTRKEKPIGKLERKEDLYYTRYNITYKGRHGYDYIIKWNPD